MDYNLVYQIVFWPDMFKAYDYIGEWTKVDDRFVRVLSVKDSMAWHTFTMYSEPLTYYSKN